MNLVASAGLTSAWYCLCKSDDAKMKLLAYGVSDDVDKSFFDCSPCLQVVSIC